MRIVSHDQVRGSSGHMHFELFHRILNFMECFIYEKRYSCQMTACVLSANYVLLILQLLWPLSFMTRFLTSTLG